MECPQWLSGKACAWDFPRSSDFPSGLRPLEKSDDPRQFPRANFSRKLLQTFHCLYHMSDRPVFHYDKVALPMIVSGPFTLIVFQHLLWDWRNGDKPCHFDNNIITLIYLIEAHI